MPFATKSCRPPFAKNQIEMDAEHLGRVERRMPAEQPLPDHRDNRRRNHDLRKTRQAFLPDLTALDAELDQRAHAGQAAWSQPPARRSWQTPQARREPIRRPAAALPDG